MASTESDLPFALEPFPSFDCEMEIQSVGIRWTKYMKRFTNFMIATGVTNDARKRALLLHYVGESTSDVFDTLADTGTTFDEAVNAFNAHFVPVVNLEYETYTFRQIRQFEGELIEQFHVRLRKSAVKCNFQDVNREIKSQLIVGCANGKLRRHALRTPSATLPDLLQFGKTTEVTEQHSTEIESATSAKLNWINHKHGNKNHKENRPSEKPRDPRVQKNRQANDKQWRTSMNQEESEQEQRSKMCNNCGYEWHRGGNKACRARTAQCNKCGKRGHYARVCRQPFTKERGSVAAVDETKDTSDEEDAREYIFANSSYNIDSRLMEGEINLSVLGNKIKFMIDSGATVDILSHKDYKRIKPSPSLVPTQKIILPYGQNTPLPVLGQLEVTLANRNTKCTTTLQVSMSKGPSILSKLTSLQLGLIKFVNNVGSKADINYNEYVKEHYPKLYEGIGKCHGIQIKLHIDKEIVPVCNKHRRIPFHLRPEVEKELKILEEKGIIERVPNGVPTPWVSPLVIVPKKHDSTAIRICVDMREPNVAIKRERHITPTLDDTLHDLNGCAHFSRLDLRQGYHQLELENDSRNITTFTTHLGLFRYKRLSFGINAAAEVFQNTIWNIIKDIPHVLNISDDILIYGRTKQQHDEALIKTLSRLYKKGITLNKEKCIFNTSRLLFFGHVLSKEGIQVDPEKIESISKLPIPTNPTEARSMLGMITFCSRFIPNLSAISEPIRRLTKAGQEWNWDEEHQTAFSEIVRLLRNSVKLAYFDKTANTEIWTDASPKGVAGILVQKKGQQTRIIAFASRSLSDAESRYAQIEREALAITWATQHFRMYVYGAEFRVITDHKPLVTLFNGPRAKLSVRLERWRMNLQDYRFEVAYRDGKQNPADYLSRHPHNSRRETPDLAVMADKHAHLMTMHDIPKNVPLAEIERETYKDMTLQSVIASLRTYFQKDAAPKGVDSNIYARFRKVKDELATNRDGTILLKGSRIVVPASLQDRVIDIAHSGHSGIVRTKQLLRTKVWFPFLNLKVEEKIKNCLMCQAATPTEHKMPLQTSRLPDGPWEVIHMDHKGPLPTGDYLLVIVDLYTRFPIVETVRTTRASENIPKLEDVFALLGSPRWVCTDNGPPFNGQEFSRFLERHGANHRKMTPAWPQANGAVERFNRTLGKTLKIAFTYKKDWKQALREMLRTYRATPHSTTQLSPADLLYNRSIQIGLPSLAQTPLSPSIAKEKLCVHDQKKKSYHKKYHDTHNTMMTPLQVGDCVLVRKPQKSKNVTAYDPRPYTVTKIKESMVTSERPGHQITRNASFYKTIPKTTSVGKALQEVHAYDRSQEPDQEQDIPSASGEAPENAKTMNHERDVSIPSKRIQNNALTKDSNRNQAMEKTKYFLRNNVKPPSRLIEAMN